MSQSKELNQTLTPQKRGRQNQSRGAAFEKIVAARPAQLGLDLMIKRIDRTHRRGISLPDIEIIDFPDFKLDCKFTESEFSVREKRKLVIECHSKYCIETESAIVICGEKKDKSRLIVEDVLVCFISSGLLLIVPLDDWLKHLHLVKLKQLRRET
jgi:hypothetical protein